MECYSGGEECVCFWNVLCLSGAVCGCSDSTVMCFIVSYRDEMKSV